MSKDDITFKSVSHIEFAFNKDTETLTHKDIFDNTVIHQFAETVDKVISECTPDPMLDKLIAQLVDERIRIRRRNG